VEWNLLDAVIVRCFKALEGVFVVDVAAVGEPVRGIRVSETIDWICKTSREDSYHPPSEIAETFRPERPKKRYSIGESGSVAIVRCV